MTLPILETELKPECSVGLEVSSFWKCWLYYTDGWVTCFELDHFLAFGKGQQWWLTGVQHRNSIFPNSCWHLTSWATSRSNSKASFGGEVWSAAAILWSMEVGPWSDSPCCGAFLFIIHILVQYCHTQWFVVLFGWMERTLWIATSWAPLLYLALHCA